MTVAWAGDFSPSRDAGFGFAMSAPESDERRADPTRCTTDPEARRPRLPERPIFLSGSRTRLELWGRPSRPAAGPWTSRRPGTRAPPRGICRAPRLFRRRSRYGRFSGSPGQQCFWAGAWLRPGCAARGVQPGWRVETPLPPPSPGARRRFLPSCQGRSHRGSDACTY